MTRIPDLWICEKKSHLPEHDGATGYFYYEPLEPYYPLHDGHAGAMEETGRYKRLKPREPEYSRPCLKCKTKGSVIIGSNMGEAIYRDCSECDGVGKLFDAPRDPAPIVELIEYLFKHPTTPASSIKNLALEALHKWKGE